MRQIWILISLAVLLSAVATGGRVVQSQEAQTSRDLPKNYLPDLGDFMAAVQRNHEKLWLAGAAQNWPLADYQLSELKEVLSDVEDYVQTYRNIPVGEMIDSLITGPIADLERATEAQEFTSFSASFDALTRACNSCHSATGKGFIVIRRPTQPAYSNQDFAPKAQ